jgi:putative hydrolase of HD superfamily
LERFGVEYVETLLSPSYSEVSASIRDAWLEYEEGKTPESQFVREMDKLECLMQALRYERQTFGEKDLKEFQGLSTKISSPLGIAWMDLLNQEREAHFTKRRERTPVIFVIGVKDTQCALLSKQFGFQTTTLDEVLREKANDDTHPCAKYIQHCIQEDIQVPIQLAISILERKINEGIQKGMKWTLLRGFPESIQHLTVFQEQVSIGHLQSNYTYFSRFRRPTTHCI